MTVKNGTGKNAVKIGTVNDVILNKNHEVVGVLVGVGGFLGIAETNYGVAWDALRINETKGIIVVDITRKQLDRASSYMTLAEQKAKQQHQRAKQKVQQQKSMTQQQKTKMQQQDHMMQQQMQMMQQQKPAQ